MKPFKSLNVAISHARSRARITGEEHYVVREDGYYHTCTEEDLDTYFAAVKDEDVVYCTLDDWDD